MGYYHITTFSKENIFHFTHFIQGDERSLAYIYSHLFRTVSRHGLRIVQDEFVVSSVTQEAFLKLWAFRERMTSMDHIVKFLKLTVRWECLAYYRSPVERFYRNLDQVDWIENLCVSEDDYDSTYAENQLRVLRSLIPNLPGSMPRTIISLYAKDGLSFKQIAERLNISIQAVSYGLQQSISTLRSMLGKPERTAAVTVPYSSSYTLAHRSGLSNEQSHIFTLRYEMKYNFSQISDLLKLPQAYVQKQYVEAHRILKAS